jgi:ABC-2 type transport system permease protein
LFVLALIPVGFGLIAFMTRQFLEAEGINLFAQFSKVSFLLLLHFLLPLLAVFVGAAVIADEIEDRTLPYLLVRPVRRSTIVLAKALAGILTVGVILLLSLWLTYSIMSLTGEEETWATEFPVLLQTSGVLLLGVVAYLPFFAFLGGAVKRPAIVGIVLVFGWEKMVAFFPGNVKLFTIAHYLHVLFPELERARPESAPEAFLNLAVPTTEVSGFTAALTLLAIGAVFLALAAALPVLREYRLDQSA